MPPHSIAGHAPALAVLFNAFLFVMNIALYVFTFRYAKKQNRRLAALVRRVRAEMEHDSVMEFPAGGGR